MLPLRHARRWQIASWLVVSLVLVAALVPEFWDWGNKIKSLFRFSRLDLLLHAGVFAALSVWFMGLYRKSSYWKVALGLLIFGIAIELCQRAVGYRTADLADIGADAAGIAIGVVLALLGAGNWCQWFEAWLERRETSTDA